MSDKWRWAWGTMSLSPPTLQKHYFMCDIDGEIEEPLAPDELCFKTPHGYHIYNFDVELTLNDLVEQLKLRKADATYTHLTKKRGFATLEFRSMEERFYVSRHPICFLKFQRYIGGDKGRESQSTRGKDGKLEMIEAIS